jgi:UDP-N-acetylmuramate dehydrogenase
MSKSAMELRTSQHRREIHRQLSEVMGECVGRDVVLAPLTTFGIGGKADFLYRADKPEKLVRAIRTAQELRLPFLILGGGSNILVSDAGYRGLVIKNECSEILASDQSLTCQSGAALRDMVDLATELSLSGLEFAAGIPGTVGGAVRGNAGAFGEAIGQAMTRAVILTDKGDIREVKKAYLEFGYRDSRLKRTREVVLSASFELTRRSRRQIEKKVEANHIRRNERIPWQSKSAGCFFKNVDGPRGKIPAGLLLEKVGAKGMRRGDAQVSQLHANVLVNSGRAKATDVRKLARILKEKVTREFGLELEEEVAYINPSSGRK